MAESNVNIMLDTVRRNRISVIYAVENDYGARFITAAIMTDGKKKAVKKTAVVTINAERPDGQRKAFEGSVNEDGTVKVPVTQWMLEFEGEVVCSVSVVTSTSRLTTTHFYIQAQYSVWDGTSAPSADDPDKDVIVSIIAAENERVANENARISAENTRRTAETARIDAENTRIAKESVRVSNEAERVSAESVRKTEFATWQGEIGKISAFDKRIENLETAVTPGLVTPMVDDSMVYQKNVPTGALPNAMISEIGGMTRKCTNLFDVNAFRDDITQSVFYYGTFYLKPNTTYTASCNVPAELNDIIAVFLFNSTDQASGAINKIYKGRDVKITTNADGIVKLQYINNNLSYNIKNYEFMLNEGNTALPYDLYFTGLRDAKVTAVESVGVNLIPFPYASASHTVNGITFTINEDGTITANGTATAIAEMNVMYKPSENTLFKKGVTYTISDGTSNPSNLTYYIYVNGIYADGTEVSLMGTYYSSAKTFTSTDDLIKGVIIRLVIANGMQVSNLVFKPMLNEGDTVLPYTPYFKNTFPIPEAVQALDGYGQGISKEYHNKIVLDPASGMRKFVRKIGCVDMGTLNWAKSGTNNIYFVRLSDAVYYGSSIVGNALCAKYTTESSTRNDKSLLFGSPFIGDGTSSVVVHDDDYIDAATFKEAMIGVMLVYELETPTETDLSDYFGDDNYIGVEAGGTVTMVNEYEYDVPSVIEYTVKGVDAT